jgi:hypothetical protein
VGLQGGLGFVPEEEEREGGIEGGRKKERVA